MAALSVEISRPNPQSLVIRQRLGTTLVAVRLALGVPMLAAGLYMLAQAVLGPASFYMADGPAGLLSAIPGVLVALFLAAIFTPLGWYLMFVRIAKGIDGGGRQIYEFVDWRVGRKLTNRSADEFKEVWTGEDDVSVSENRQGKGRALFVRLLPANPEEHPSFDLAMFDLSQRRQAEDLSKQVAGLLALSWRNETESSRLR